MATWQDIINKAAEDIGLIQAGENLSTATSINNDFFNSLKRLISSLSTESKTCYTQKTYSFQLQPGVSAYTVGAGGSMNTAERVQKLMAWRANYANVVQTGGRVVSLEDLGAAAATAGVVKAVPDVVGADAAYPLINLRVSPPPSTTPGVLEFTGFVALTQPGAVGDSISLPEGWERMLTKNLASEMYPSYARAGFDPTVLLAQAQSSKASLVDQLDMSAPQQPK